MSQTHFDLINVETAAVAREKNRKIAGDTPLTYAQKVASKEANILGAAKRVFAQAGYSGLRMSVVAKQAGVAEGTVYSYFASKDDLIRALIGAYWTQLTLDARKAIQGSAKADSFSALRALAEFHIENLITRYDYAELTITLGRQTGSAVSFTDEVRSYVRVFDDIFRAGQDRGEIDGAAQVWIARDMFYGSLEYSARTLIFRGAGADATQDVVDNLMQSFEARYGAANVVKDAAGVTSGGAQAALMRRQEASVIKLEQICKALERPQT